MFFRGRAPVPADWSKRMDDWPPLETVEAMFGSVEAAAAAARPERNVSVRRVRYTGSELRTSR